MKRRYSTPENARSNQVSRHYFRALLALGIAAFCGCNSNKLPTDTSADHDDDPWTITELRADHGHDTMESDDGGMYHNYYCAVVLERHDESIHLLYENNLPKNLDLKIGDRYHIDGVAAATYSDHWHGYWIHHVQLQHADAR